MKDWMLTKPVDLLVVLLANLDIVLGMPFLKQEKITVNADNDNIILLTLPSTMTIQSSQINPLAPSDQTVSILNKERTSRTAKQALPTRIQSPTDQKLTVTFDTEQVKKWHNNTVKEFSDMFYNKPLALKDRRLPKDAPFH